MPDGAVPDDIFCGAVRLDRAELLLFAADGRTVPLRPRAAEVLDMLLRQAGRVVTRAALLDAVWRGLPVTDDNLTQSIGEIRRALAGSGVTVQTVSRKGYRIAPGEPAEPPSVAVRPFAQQGAQALGESLAQEVAVELARAGLRVTLGGRAPYQLRGSLRPFGASHRLVVQLVEAGSLLLRWGEFFDLGRDQADGFACRIAEQVHGQLQRQARPLGGYAEG